MEGRSFGWKTSGSSDNSPIEERNEERKTMRTVEKWEEPFRALTFRETRTLVKTTDFELLWSKKTPRLRKSHVYIYGLADPRNKQVRYIGRTVGPLAVRVYQHIRNAKRGRSYKDRWINSLLKDGYEPKAVVICTVPSEEARRAEALVMRRFDYEAGPLVNTEIMKSHLRDVQIRIWNRGKVLVSWGHPDYQNRHKQVRAEVEKFLGRVLDGKPIYKNARRSPTRLEGKTRRGKLR
jgi:hypothetical protein